MRVGSSRFHKGVNEICFRPALSLRLHLPVPFTRCRHQAAHPRLPVAKERFPLVAPVHDIIQRARILDAQVPNHGFMVKVTTPWMSTEYFNLFLDGLLC